VVAAVARHAERIEQARQERRRDGALVVDLEEQRLGGAAVDPDVDVAAGRRVLPGVGDQVRDDLEQAIGIPGPALIAGEVAPDLAVGVDELELADGLAAQVGEVGLAGLDLDPAAGARAREVEQLIDHARHPLAARQDPAQRLGVAVALTLEPHQHELRGGHHRAERVPEVVGQDAGEQLLVADRLLELGDRGEPRRDRREVVGDRARQLELARREDVRPDE
jgi:hypothetical protein